jgi:hypothetical protein
VRAGVSARGGGRAILIAACGMLAACATEIAVRPPAADPSRPEAEEAAAAPAPSLNAPDPLLAPAPPSATPPAHGHDHGMHHGAAHGGYTCRMHPAVRAPAAGSCPICGMALIAVEEKP